MSRNQIRNLAIALLNDDNGINEVAWDLLWEQLIDHNCIDITASVECTDGRYYLPEGWKEDKVIEDKDIQDTSWKHENSWIASYNHIF